MIRSRDHFCLRFSYFYGIKMRRVLPGRLMVGHLVLVQGIEVRVLAGQHEKYKISPCSYRANS